MASTFKNIVSGVSYRQLYAERRPVEQVHSALDDVPGAVDGLVRRRRPAAASQAKISESEIRRAS